MDCGQDSISCHQLWGRFNQLRAWHIIGTNKVVINYYSLFSSEVTGYFDQTPFFSLPCCALAFLLHPARFKMLPCGYKLTSPEKMAAFLRPRTQARVGSQTRSLRNEPQPTTSLGHCDGEHRPVFLNTCSQAGAPGEPPAPSNSMWCVSVFPLYPVPFLILIPFFFFCHVDALPAFPTGWQEEQTHRFSERDFLRSSGSLACEPGTLGLLLCALKSWELLNIPI